MKRFLIIAVSMIVLLHSFVAWIHISYPQPDPTETFRLWEQGYVDFGLPDWRLPAVAENTVLLWFPFWATIDLGTAYFPLAVRVCVSAVGWFLFAVGSYSVVRFFRRRHQHVAA